MDGLLFPAAVSERAAEVRRAARPGAALLLMLTLLAACASGPDVSAPGTGPGASSSLPAETVSFRVALLITAPELGQLEHNINALAPLVEQAFDGGARLVVAPELATTGYSITAEQVRNGLGLAFPDAALEQISRLARVHRGYVHVGVAEVSESGRLYSSVFAFGPDGPIEQQRKRGLAGWNERGDLSFDVISTSFAELGSVICSDSYLQDWVRISALHGADVVVAPANWWGANGQVDIWRTRAQENGVWMVVANRWGSEVDRRFDPPYTYLMNDAPTAIISPDGKLEQLYRADQSPDPEDRIVYHDIEVPLLRVNGRNQTYTVAHRRPSAYPAIANELYRSDLGNSPAPGLPRAGVMKVAALTFVPTADPEKSLETINRLLGEAVCDLDLVVLPGLAVSQRPIRGIEDLAAGVWQELAETVSSNRVELLVTTAYLADSPGRPGSALTAPPLALVVLRPGRPPLLRAQIHDAWGALGTGEPPLVLDTAHARIGLVTGVDLLFPELATHLAKSGVDIVAVPSVVASEMPRQLDPRPLGWSAEDLIRAWRTRSNQCFHVIGSDAGGQGAIIKDGGCYNLEVLHLDSSPELQLAELDSSTERVKKLNVYHEQDLDALLGDRSGLGKARPALTARPNSNVQRLDP